MSPIPDSSLAGYDALRDRIDTALDLLSEGRNIDFKESQAYDVLKIKIIKAALAMPNVRNGGLVIIGVSERHDEWSLDGIDPGHLATYDVDKILGQIHSHASPEVRVSIVTHHKDGKDYLVLAMHEIESDVVVCRKNGPAGSGIEKGRVYTRPAGKAQSRMVESAEEMREVTDLATEKKARQIIAVSGRIGMVPAVDAEAQFDEELGDL
jgi:predicted HTH transcriptional regulator